MPLSFQSTSHGKVAFGFFNIESDMLLLDDLFFFAGGFCAAAAKIAEARRGPVEQAFEGWRISDFRKIGNLHGAIAGIDLSGFIGATYAAWPFPRAQEDFKQNPDGSRTQEAVTSMIRGFSETERIVLAADAALSSFSVCEYEFDRNGFGRLASYVERGGYPRWRDERRPDYVREMALGFKAAGWPLQ